MKQLIDKDVLVKEIEKRVEEHKETLKNCDSSISEMILKGSMSAYQSLLHFLGTIEVKEEEEYQQPKHSYFHSVFHCGSEPRWKVGDILAVYHFYSDYEGEETIGEIVEVKMEDDDWVYTFKDGQVDYESVLITDEAYKKN